MAVDVLPAAAHHSPGNSAAATPASSISSSSSSTVVPASAAAAAAAIGFAASAYCVSSLLPYYATFAASLVCFARAVWPDRVDAALADARADLEADLRRLRDYVEARAHAHPHPALTAAAEECARRARATVAAWRRRAAARWDEHRDAACAARFLLGVAALVARLAATVVFDAACDEARARAPSVLGYLRGLADGIRAPSTSPLSSSCNKAGEDDEAAAAAGGFVLKDVVCLVGAGFYLLFTMHLLFGSSAASGLQFCAVCFAATCGLTMVIADWVDPTDDDAEETDTPAAGTDDDSRRPEVDAAVQDSEASRDEEVEVRESWRFLWVLVLITYCVDAFLLHVTLGPKPATLAILALCNWEVLKFGRQVQLAPDGVGEGAAESSSVQGVQDGAVDKWRRGAMVVYAACSVKIFVVYFVLNCCMAALGFLWLFVMADLLLAEEDNLSDFDASGEDDGEDGEEIPALEEDITGGAEEEVDEEARKEHSNRNSSSEDEEESFARCYSSSSEDEEESSVHCDISSEDEEETSVHGDSSEDHEIFEEQRQEEPDYSSGGSTDDSWDFVDVDDPEMPAAKANCAANRKSMLFPWKKNAA